MKADQSTVAFDWDSGNAGKNEKHRVGDWECEEVFFDQEKVILKDVVHSGPGKRFILLGKTREKRLLFVVFTHRQGKVRIISARDINKREIHLYEKAT